MVKKIKTPLKTIMAVAIILARLGMARSSCQRCICGPYRGCPSNHSCTFGQALELLHKASNRKGVVGKPGKNKAIKPIVIKMTVKHCHKKRPSMVLMLMTAYTVGMAVCHFICFGFPQLDNFNIKL